MFHGGKNMIWLIIGLLILTLCILGISFFVILTYMQRKRSFIVKILNKEELLIKLNPYLFKYGYTLQIDNGNIILYQKIIGKIAITIDNNQATITGQGNLIKKILKKTNLLI